MVEKAINKSGDVNYSSLRATNSRLPALCDFLPEKIAVPHGATVTARLRGKLHEITVSNFSGCPALIQQDGRWLLIPFYENVVAVCFGDLPGDFFLYKPRRETWDTYLSDFSLLTRAAPLRARDARRFADRVRIGKEKHPHQSVTAGYLYEFSNDYDNIARTAHYMAGNTGRVPFDLALLCADHIHWRREEGRLVAHADLPAVVEAPSGGDEDERPYYASVPFSAKAGIPLWGIAPIFSQGWHFMRTEKYLEMPEKIRRIGAETRGRSAVSLTDKGADWFCEAFDYRVEKMAR